MKVGLGQQRVGKQRCLNTAVSSGRLPFSALAETLPPLRVFPAAQEEEKHSRSGQV